VTGAPPPANWYPDPDGSGGLRWWDGGTWTWHRVLPQPPVTQSYGTYGPVSYGPVTWKGRRLGRPPTGPGALADPGRRLGARLLDLLNLSVLDRTPRETLRAEIRDAVVQLLTEEKRKSKIENQKSGAVRLSYVETITVLDRPPAALGWGDDTIVFFNDSDRFDYARPAEPVDLRSGVICLPNNFDYGPDRQLSEGFFRCTCLANYDRWARLPEATYRADKQRWFAAIQQSARRFLPPLVDPGSSGGQEAVSVGTSAATAIPANSAPDVLAQATVATDMFTPRTIEHFTGHLDGAVYGAPVKNREGRTALGNLYLCGTDQGFLGIVGAMLSGISMANYHVLQKSAGG